MSDQLIQRAGLLLQQKKYKEAENILSGLFAEDPTNVSVIAMMCEVKIQMGQHQQALELVNSAIGIDPSVDYLFYKRAYVYIHLDKYDEAEKDLEQAIALDPYDANYFALFALLKLDRKKFAEASDLAAKALELDPENITALNARSTALLKLNRKEESFRTIEGALREDPDNAYTHANYGWGLLEKGSHKDALQHFSMALHKDPNLQLAQVGMAEALKAKYFIYRAFMKYYFWMGNLSAKYQWAFIIGLYAASRVLNYIATVNPAFSPYINPILICLMLFAFSTWIVTPLSNLFLRLNKYGRYLLKRDQILTSNFVGISTLLSLAGLALYAFTGEEFCVLMMLVGLTLMIPLGMMLSSTPKMNILLVGYTAVLALLGTLSIIASASGQSAGTGLLGTYFIALFIFQLLVNFVVIKRNNR